MTQKLLIYIFMALLTAAFAVKCWTLLDELQDKMANYPVSYISIKE